jgi:hypothetical protein
MEAAGERGLFRAALFAGEPLRGRVPAGRDPGGDRGDDGDEILDGLALHGHGLPAARESSWPSTLIPATRDTLWNLKELDS